MSSNTVKVRGPYTPRGPHALAVIAFVAAFLNGASTAVAASWSAAIAVPGSEGGTQSAIVRDDGGVDTIGWLQSGADGAPDRVVASTRLLAGALSTGTLSTDTAAPVDAPAISGDPSGPVAVAWVARSAPDGPSQIDYVIGGRGGLGSRQTLSDTLTGDDPGSVDVAVTPAGETIFTWTRTVEGVTRVCAVVRSAAGDLSPLATLSDDQGSASAPQVATASGGALVTWLQTTSTTTTDGNVDTDTTVTRVQAARRVPSGFTVAGTLSEATETTVTTIAGENETSVTTGEKLEGPQAAVDDQDGAIVAFVLTTSIAQEPESSVARASIGTLAGGVGPPATISPAGQDVDGLSLSVARGGQGILSWTAGPSVYAARRAASGPFGSAEQVALAGSAPSAAMRAGGAPIVVFRAADQILASVGLEGGGFELPVALGPTDPPSGTPAVSADARGGAAATWTVDPTPVEGDESVRVAELQPEPESPGPPPPAPAPAPLPPQAPTAATTPPAPPPPAPTALTLTDFAVAPACIRYGAPFNGSRARLSFAFALSEAATVRLTIQRRLNSGAQRLCPSTRPRGQAGRLGSPVILDIPSGGGAGAVNVGDEGEAIVAHAASGSRRSRNRVTLTRRLKPGRRRFVIRQSTTALAPGTYVATATAATADNRATAAVKLKFWVLRPVESR